MSSQATTDDVFACVQTRAFRTAQVTCATAVRHGSIAVVYGPSGCGKTYALEAFLGTVERRQAFITAAPSPSPKQIFEELLLELTGTVDNTTSSRLRRQCIEVLDELRPVVAIDEAQHLTTLWLRQLRSLHDEGRRRWPLLLVGGRDCLDRLDASPALETRAALRVEFAALKGDVLLTTLAAAHPILANTPDQLLVDVDRRYAKGNLRRWTEFCRFGFDLVAVSGTTDRFSARTVKATFAMLGVR